MDLNLRGKTAIVTGGGSNIGRAIVLAFAAEGSNVAIAEIDEKQAQKVARQANALGGGGRTIVVKCDVARNDEVLAMVKKVIEEFKQIDILVNDAAWQRDCRFMDQPREEMQKVVNVCWWGPVNCIGAVLAHMIQRKYGKIINIGSDAGRMGEFREGIYAGCKAGVMSLSKTIAREVGRYGININTVCPGMTPPRSAEEIGEKSLWVEQIKILTPEVQEKAKSLYPLRRLGTPEDIAWAALFLASDRASFITGQTLSVSGGYTMI